MLLPFLLLLYKKSRIQLWTSNMFVLADNYYIKNSKLRYVCLTRSETIAARTPGFWDRLF